jgi:hypothetical protein
MSTKPRASRVVRRSGYAAAIAVSVVLWWAVGRLLGWGWPPFLTEDFGTLVPWFRFSLAVDIAFNVAYLYYVPRWFMAVGDAVKAGVNATVACLVLRVFPFDYSAYDFNWERLTRIVLVVAIVAAWIAVIVGIVRASYSLAHSSDAVESRDPESLDERHES